MAEENKTKYSDAELAEFKAIIVKKIMPDSLNVEASCLEISEPR